MLVLPTQCRQNGSRPKYFPHQRRNKEQASHSFAVYLLEGVEHGDVSTGAHWFGEEQATYWDAYGAMRTTHFTTILHFFRSECLHTMFFFVCINLCVNMKLTDTACLPTTKLIA